MKAGRKRCFDLNKTLEKAMLIFWENGFSATSMSTLTAGLGINKPSLYAAFGNKEQFFISTLDYYQNNFIAEKYAMLIEPQSDSLKKRLHSLLYSIADIATNPDLPRGCLFVNSSCESGSNSLPKNITDSIKTTKDSSLSFLIEAFDNEKKLGNLDKSINSKNISTHLMVVLFGMGVLAKHGSSLEDLKPVIDKTVKALIQPAIK